MVALCILAKRFLRVMTYVYTLWTMKGLGAMDIYMYSDEAFLYFGKRIREKNVSFGYELIDIHKSLEYSCFIMVHPNSTSERL